MFDGIAQCANHTLEFKIGKLFTTQINLNRAFTFSQIILKSILFIFLYL